MIDSMQSAVSVCKNQYSRFVWLYVIAVLGSVVGFYLIGDQESAWGELGDSGVKVRATVYYMIADYLFFIISFVILFKVLSFAVGMKMTYFRLLKIQIPALMTGLLLALFATGMIQMALSPILDDYVDQGLYLLVVMITITVFMSLFYFVTSIILMIRYKIRDEIGKQKQSVLDYFKAFWLAIKQAPAASLYMLVFTSLALLIKYISFWLNMSEFYIIGILIEAITIPLFAMFMFGYIIKSNDAITERITIWTKR